MRFLSIDLETTGLDPERDQILQIGVVIGDFVTPGVQALPSWECLIAHERIYGNPFAIAMNAGLIGKIARREQHPNDLFFPFLEAAYESLAGWLIGHGFEPGSDGRIQFVAAGKNVAGFDLPFLNSDENDGATWRSLFKPKHRVFDVGPLYFQHGDSAPPDLRTCLARAGIDKEVDHTAVADALDVIRLLRARYGMEPPVAAGGDPG